MMNATNLATEIKQLFRDVLTEFILHPADLKVSTIQMARAIAISTEAHAGDVARIIGERGAHFNALKAIAVCMSRKYGISIDLAPVTEPRGGKADRYGNFKHNQNWPKERILALLGRLADKVFQFESAVEITSEDAGNVTVFRIAVDQAEKKFITDTADAAFKILLNAIGKANGRTLMCEILPEREHEPHQPKTARGRFTGEVQR